MKNGVKIIQTAGYNGARTVSTFCKTSVDQLRLKVKMNNLISRPLTNKYVSHVQVANQIEQNFIINIKIKIELELYYITHFTRTDDYMYI